VALPKRTVELLKVLIERKLDGDVGDAKQTRDHAPVKAVDAFGPVDPAHGVPRMAVPLFLSVGNILGLLPL
jgi:hypothetical protein